MTKCIFIFLISCFFFTSCINQKSEALSFNDIISVKGKFIKILRADNRYSNLYLKLKSDSIFVFKTVIAIDDPQVDFFKSEGMEIELTYREHKNHLTNTVDKIVQTITPVYNFKR